MRRHSYLPVILCVSAVCAQTASVTLSRRAGSGLQDEGDVVSKSELAREIPVDKDHPLPRKLVAVQEGEISSAPTPQKIVVVHYRAEPTDQLSMNDDRIVIAVKQGDEFKILKVLDSDTVIVDGNLYSDRDFKGEFIDIHGMHFLYIRTMISGSGGIVEDNVYTISSDQKLSTILFQDVTKSSVLKEREELLNGFYRFAEDAFTFEAGIEKHDGECCPSLEYFHAQFRLKGEFKEDPQNHAFEPDFKFVVANEWRSKNR